MPLCSSWHGAQYEQRPAGTAGGEGLRIFMNEPRIGGWMARVVVMVVDKDGELDRRKMSLNISLTREGKV